MITIYSLGPTWEEDFKCYLISSCNRDIENNLLIEGLPLTEIKCILLKNNTPLPDLPWVHTMHIDYYKALITDRLWGKIRSYKNSESSIIKYRDFPGIKVPSISIL